MDKLELGEFLKAFSKLGNDVGMIIGATRNLGLDYEDASEKLRKLSQQLKMLSNKNPLLMEKAGFRDRCILIHRDKNGKIIDKRDTGWRTNTLTNAGFAEVAALMTADVGGTAFDYIAIGTNRHSTRIRNPQNRRSRRNRLTGNNHRNKRHNAASRNLLRLYRVGGCNGKRSLQRCNGGHVALPPDVCSTQY